MEELLFLLKLLALSVVELSQRVHLLHDFGEDCRRELIILVADLAVVVLERLDLSECVTA